MQEHLNNLLDHRNTDLWEKLNKEFRIDLEESPEPNYMTNVQGVNAIIRIYKFDLNPAPFTHELLHIELKSKNVQIADELARSIESAEKLSHIFSKGLKEHIGNC